MDTNSNILIVMRHAKSSWDDPALPDFDRPLANRGLAAAPAMGSWLAANAPIPERIISSPAERAIQTARLVQRELPADPPIEIFLDERIYDASLAELIAVLEMQDARVMMLVGHNPGVLELVTHLLGKDTAGGELTMPTGAIIVLTLSGTRSELAPRSAKLVAHMRPRELPREFLR